MVQVFLKHPVHGKKIASLRAEAENDKKNGWVEVTNGEFYGKQEEKEEKTHGDIVSRYVEKFGKKPHHKMKPETIEAALNDPSA